jgi:hypothetical protein
LGGYADGELRWHVFEPFLLLGAASLAKDGHRAP